MDTAFKLYFFLYIALILAGVVLIAGKSPYIERDASLKHVAFNQILLLPIYVMVILYLYGT